MSNIYLLAGILPISNIVYVAVQVHIWHLGYVRLDSRTVLVSVAMDTARCWCQDIECSRMVILALCVFWPPKCDGIFLNHPRPLKCDIFIQHCPVQVRRARRVE